MVLWAQVRLRDEEGFTIIEVLVAAFILVIGALAVFMTFAAAIHNVQRGRETQVGISVAQREMERVRVEPFEDVGIASPTPRRSADTTLPNNRVNAAGTQFNVNRSGTALNRLFVAGDLAPVKTDVASATGTPVTVYRFVVCEEKPIPSTGCQTKRIVVDVQTTPADNQAGYKHSYYELQSTIVDPEGGA